jgi:hypothetical protein
VTPAMILVFQQIKNVQALRSKSMTQNQRVEFIQRFFNERCVELMATKGKEYSLSNEDVNQNFKVTGKDINIGPKKILYIFAKKHWDAITNYIKTEKVESETIESRIADIINYMFILASLIEEERLDSYVVKEEYLKVSK